MRMARLGLFVAALAIALVLASSLQAAAPNYILISGQPLKHSIVLGDWDENLALLTALADVPRARGDAVRGLPRRRSFDLAEFWGWSEPHSPTRPGKANQHGRVYPASGSKPPIIVLMVNGYDFPRRVPRPVLQILARHHVPLRL
jgi:hypothetical protein